MGRYINHSRHPNIRPYPPIFVRGKSRIGMYSLSDIRGNDELMWDYGITTGEMPWKKSSDKVPDDIKEETVEEEETVLCNFEQILSLSNQRM